MVRWRGLVPPRGEINDIFSTEDWATTLVAAAGEPEIKNKLVAGYAASSSTGPTMATSSACATISGRRCPSNRERMVSTSGPGY
jgi:arylsulfatase A-like enzyme